MEQNNRQLDADHRLAIEDCRRGLVESALSRYDATGRVVRSPNASAAYDAMVTEWWACASVGEPVPMIAGPNVTRSALNRRARAIPTAEARIAGPVMVAHDRESFVGEWVVSNWKRCDPRSAERNFMKTGRPGVVPAAAHRPR